MIACDEAIEYNLKSEGPGGISLVDESSSRGFVRTLASGRARQAYCFDRTSHVNES